MASSSVFVIWLQFVFVCVSVMPHFLLNATLRIYLVISAIVVCKSNIFTAVDTPILIFYRIIQCMCCIPPDLDSARFVYRIVRSLWHLTDISAAVLPRCLSNFEAMLYLELPLSRLRDFEILRLDVLSDIETDPSSPWITSRSIYIEIEICWHNICIYCI